MATDRRLTLPILWKFQLCPGVRLCNGLGKTDRMRGRHRSLTASLWSQMLRTIARWPTLATFHGIQLEFLSVRVHAGCTCTLFCDAAAVAQPGVARNQPAVLFLRCRMARFSVGFFHHLEPFGGKGDREDCGAGAVRCVSQEAA